MATRATKRSNIPKSKKVKRLERSNERSAKTENVVETPSERTVTEVFASIEEVRKRAKPLPKGMTVKDLIEESRL